MTLRRSACAISESTRWGACNCPPASARRAGPAFSSAASAADALSWIDAHLWAYAEHYGLRELLSEDFQHDRTYGTVRVVDPFA